MTSLFAVTATCCTKHENLPANLQQTNITRLDPQFDTTYHNYTASCDTTYHNYTTSCDTISHQMLQLQQLAIAALFFLVSHADASPMARSFSPDPVILTDFPDPSIIKVDNTW
jgi:hypothetical protein